ncbi:MAG: molybdopterin-guanine dinucleotide biosynthesis protein MobB [Caldivirga sp.]|nr:molybdopterin-guanine dinucleotide biosynthesis protein MobB [Caldivirga sp.]
MITIAFIGFRKSGKTTLIRELLHVVKGRVAVIKRIHDYGQEFDVRGKDTWVFSREGAETVIGLAPDKTHILFNRPIELNKVINMISELTKPDYLMMEGFSDEVKDRSDVIKVILPRSIGEVEELTNGVKPPLIIYCGLCKCRLEGCVDSVNELINRILSYAAN